MPPKPNVRIRYTHSHAIRPAVPLTDYDSLKANDCNWPRCPKPATHVHTWRRGTGPNAEFCGRLLCEAHAKQTAIAKNLTAP